MNKLIIVGNGFDIHNGLPTRYSDFLKWYLNNCLNTAFKIFFDNVPLNNDFILSIDDLFKIRITRHNSGIDVIDITNIEQLTKIICEDGVKTFGNLLFSYSGIMINIKVQVTSLLMESLLRNQQSKNWVDIEMAYYKLLKDSLKEYEKRHSDHEYSIDNLMKINNDLNTIKEYLEKYLIEVSAGKSVNSNFDYCAAGTIDSNIIIDTHHLNDLSQDDFEPKSNKYIVPKKVLFLNFNYTVLPYKLKRMYYDYIDIHGSLKNPNNRPIFGFGDEVDSDYLEMEKTNMNEFLTHIKSFGYFQNSNYHKLINFLKSDSYVVYIWGHSCGLSDRTLLSMVFEHDNCAAIKPYYWKKENGVDNYTEITQNISRHFKNKLKLRNRVVNKELCFPLGSQH